MKMTKQESKHLKLKVHYKNTFFVGSHQNVPTTELVFVYFSADDVQMYQ